MARRGPLFGIKVDPSASNPRLADERTRMADQDETAGVRYAPARPGIGGMNHLALDVDEASFSDALERLRAEGVEVRGPIDRGYERSIYFKDPNGVRLELLVWLTPPPQAEPAPADLPQAAIIKRAQAIAELRAERRES